MAQAMIETDVAIVGAGGGGAVLALMLAQQGIRSLVLERAGGPPQGLRGEILQPNGSGCSIVWDCSISYRFRLCDRCIDSISAGPVGNGCARSTTVTFPLPTIVPW
jgi:choline dehydrogenase-like flavoprotein